MENPTPFDLNEAIRRWKQSIGNSPTFCADDLEELASHLRASTTKLAATGLSEEEAFLIARRRLGERESLEREFAKINTTRAWAMAAFWMVLGVFVFDIGRAMSSAFTTLWVKFQPLPSRHGMEFVWLSHVVEYGSTALLVLAIAFLMTKRRKNCEKLARWCLSHTVLIIALLTSFVAMIYLLPMSLTDTRFGTGSVFGEAWEYMVPALIVIVGWPVVLAIAMMMLAKRGLGGNEKAESGKLKAEI